MAESRKRHEVEVNKLFKPASPPISEYAESQKVFNENRERLKAERLAREAVGKKAG